MELLGVSHLPQGRSSESTAATFRGRNPATGQELDPPFHDASEADVDAALQTAEAAFEPYRSTTPADRAAFLRAIADEIVALGDLLLARAEAETGLPGGRLTGERGRTVGQLRMFADLVEEGSWVDARIDTALPDRAPLPRPDLRRMLVPIGPVAVFGASNFPLAFSVAGGDTASALAAGCPVVFKAHPAHPGTSELVARALLRAADASGMPAGVFSLLQGSGHDVGMALVRHPLTRAVGFTGSLKGGRALFDAAAQRPEPIPVYAEMGSVNPVFVLSSALAKRADRVAEGLVGSITMGVGQFCTNPGVVVAQQGSGMDDLLAGLGEGIRSSTAAPMLYGAICSAYQQGTEALQRNPEVKVLGQSEDPTGEGRFGRPAVFVTSADAFRQQPELRHEVFGPSSLVVVAGSDEEMMEVAAALEGQLTITVHGEPDDLLRHADLIRLLERRAGRLIFNGYPTGVEVSHAMQHGGPYPATTNAATTSVGSAAIFRFARPVAYQGFPDEALPAELRNVNDRGIWRLLNGEWSREGI